MWGHKGTGKKFRGRRVQRFYTKSENKDQESRYVRRGVMAVVVQGGLWLIRQGCPQGTVLML